MSKQLIVMCSTMKSPSMELFKKSGWQTVWWNPYMWSHSWGCQLWPPLAGLFEIFPNSQHMVFLDSLYQGVKRMQHFLECAQTMSPTTQVALDWKDWSFYIMPREDLHQQRNAWWWLWIVCRKMGTTHRPGSTFSYHREWHRNLPVLNNFRDVAW